jgi:hypothetical protein
VLLEYIALPVPGPACTTEVVFDVKNPLRQTRTLSRPDRPANGILQCQPRKPQPCPQVPALFFDHESGGSASPSHRGM